MVDTLGHSNLDLNLVFESLELYIYRPSRRQREATGGPLETTETTEASPHAQILAWSGNIFLYRRRQDP